MSRIGYSTRRTATLLKGAPTLQQDTATATKGRRGPNSFSRVSGNLVQRDTVRAHEQSKSVHRRLDAEESVTFCSSHVHHAFSEALLGKLVHDFLMRA